MSVPTVTTSPENYAPILLNHNLRRVYIMYVARGNKYMGHINLEICIASWEV